jgi:hypothetical protein
VVSAVYATVCVLVAYRIVKHREFGG